MNKFLKGSVRGTRKNSDSDSNRIQEHDTRGIEILDEANAAWASLEQARRKFDRSDRYARGDQWGDFITDPDTGERMTERQLILKQGKVPLQTNMIAPILKNIDGQFRTSMMRPICSVRDKDEHKVGEMMTLAMEYNQDINMIEELDANALNYVEEGGFVGQRINYGWNPIKNMQDAWVYNINPKRLFFNTDVEDERLWDIRLVGEIYDMEIDKIISMFAKKRGDEDKIRSFYGRTYDKNYGIWDYGGLMGHQTKNIDFFTPFYSGMCRLILVWRLETEMAYFCHDTRKGTWFWVDKKNIGSIDAENLQRIDEGTAHGMLPEDVLTIEHSDIPEKHEYWRYYYLTPWGDILQEGESPYWHHGPNIVVHVYPLINGEVHNFVEDFIDQNRSINRTFMLIDFIRSSSAKGLLIVNEDALQDMTREEIVDEFVRYNGVIFARPKQGVRIQDVVTQLQGQGAVAGDFEVLNLQLKLINEISGVNSAIQGKSASAGTAASLYAQQVQNSALNLKGLLNSFNTFRRRRDTVLMQTIQQYYDSKKLLNISGNSYSKESVWYDPDKVQAAELDLKLVDGVSSPSYKAMQDEQLVDWMKNGLIDIEQMLENSSFPFRENLLMSIRKKRGDMEQGNLGGQIPVPQGNQLTDMMMNGKPGALDGFVQRM